MLNRSGLSVLVAGALLLVLAACGDSDGGGSGAGSGESGSPAIVAAAKTFLGILTNDEKQTVLFDRGDKEQKQRWSNRPEGLYQRQGLMTGNLDQTKIDAFLDVMKATLSTEGYERVVAEWSADDALATGGGGSEAAPGGGRSGGPDGTRPSGMPGGQGAPGGSGGPPGDGSGSSATGATYGRKYYWIAIIGEPSATEPWQWQFGGHNVTVNATITGDALSLTPSFIGAQPASYSSGGATVRPLGDIEDEAFALVNSLGADLKAKAVLGATPIGLVLGPGRDCRTVEGEGLAGRAMSAEQQDAFLALINEYGGLAEGEFALKREAQLKQDLPGTYLAWYGPTTPGSAAYFRVTGPNVVIEYSPQPTGGDAAGHIHGIYRDPTNDYGGTVCS